MMVGDSAQKTFKTAENRWNACLLPPRSGTVFCAGSDRTSLLSPWMPALNYCPTRQKWSSRSSLNYGQWPIRSVKKSKMKARQKMPDPKVTDRQKMPVPNRRPHPKMLVPKGRARPMVLVRPEKGNLRMSIRALEMGMGPDHKETAIRTREGAPVMGIHQAPEMGEMAMGTKAAD